VGCGSFVCVDAACVVPAAVVFAASVFCAVVPVAVAAAPSGWVTVERFGAFWIWASTVGATTSIRPTTPTEGRIL
jgi:hypothetical protein